MRKEDLKVGMKINIPCLKNQVIRVVTGIGKNNYLFIYPDENDERVDYLNHLDNFEPVLEKKKITLYRYTYQLRYGFSITQKQSEWSNKSIEEYKSDYGRNFKLLTTESKEIEIDEE